MNFNEIKNTPFYQVVRIRPFLFLWTGQVISQIAQNMMVYVLVLKVYALTNSTSAVSALVLAVALPSIFFGITAGVFVDRWEKRKVLTICNLSRAFIIFGFFFTSENYFWIFVLAILASSVNQFFVPAEAPSLPRLVPENLLLTANSLFTLTFYVSVMLGYLLSGPALLVFGDKNVFILIALLMLLAAILVSRLPVLSNGHKGQSLSKIWNELLEGFSYVRKEKKIGNCLLLLIASQGLIAALGALAPAFADKIMHINTNQASVFILGPAALGVGVGALLVGHIGARFNKQKLTNIGIFGAGLGLTLLPISLWFSLIAVFLFFLIGLFNAFVDVPSNTTLQEESDDNIRGRVYGLLTAFGGAAAILPVSILGVFADLIGVKETIMIVGIIIVGYGIFRIKNSYAIN